MTLAALLFICTSRRPPRRVLVNDRRRNAAFVLNGRVFAGIAWRAAR